MATRLCHDCPAGYHRADTEEGLSMVKTHDAHRVGITEKWMEFHRTWSMWLGWLQFSE